VLTDRLQGYTSIAFSQRCIAAEVKTEACCLDVSACILASQLMDARSEMVGKHRIGKLFMVMDAHVNAGVGHGMTDQRSDDIFGGAGLLTGEDIPGGKQQRW